jgi:hypothetical protein
LQIVGRAGVALEFTDPLPLAGVTTSTTLVVGNITSTATVVGAANLLGPWDNVIVARFPDEHSSAISSAIAALFIVSSVCCVLSVAFFFSYAGICSRSSSSSATSSATASPSATPSTSIGAVRRGRCARLPILGYLFT